MSQQEARRQSPDQPKSEVNNDVSVKKLRRETQEKPRRRSTVQEQKRSEVSVKNIVRDQERHGAVKKEIAGSKEDQVVSETKVTVFDCKIFYLGKIT